MTLLVEMHDGRTLSYGDARIKSLGSWLHVVSDSGVWLASYISKAVKKTNDPMDFLRRMGL